MLVALPFRTAKEAVALANNTCYGLAGSVWTENVSLAMEVALLIKAGAIWVSRIVIMVSSSGYYHQQYEVANRLLVI